MKWLITSALCWPLIACNATSEPASSGGGTTVAVPDAGPGAFAAPEVADHDDASTPASDDLPAAPDAGPVGGPDVGGDSVSEVPPTGAAIVVNEIMYDPKQVPDDQGEWIELYNAGAAPVDVAGWRLSDAFGGHTIAGSVVVPAGGYAVLGAVADPAKNGGYTAQYAYGDAFKLKNSGTDQVILSDPSGAVVDQVTYGVEAPWPAAVPGRSIELQSPGLDNAAPGSWAVAVAQYGDGDFGTPGGPNGQPPPPIDIDLTPAWHSETLSAAVRFSPAEDLEGHVLAELGAAELSVRLAFFNIRLDGVLDLLIALHQEGVDVRVALDKKQQDLEYNTAGADLAAAGVPVTLVENLSAEQSTMHDKFTVIDQHRVLTGSANYSVTALNLSDEDLLTIDSSDLAARYTAEFDEMAAATPPQKSPAYAAGAKARAWFGPEDDLDGKILPVIQGAQTSIRVAMFQLNHGALTQALIDAHAAGKNVLVILDAVQAAQDTETADEALAAAGVPLILAENTLGMQTEMHSKLLVVDHARVVMGSLNWTNLGVFFNEENIVVLDDPDLAVRAEGQIARLVAAYGPDPATLGLTTGDRAVTLWLTHATLASGAVLQLTGDSFPTSPLLADTKAELTLPAGTTLTYRYKVVGAGGQVLPEGSTHTFTVPYAPGPFVVRDVWLP